MKIEGKDYKTIWFEDNKVKIIDQTKLPHKFLIKELKTCDDAVVAIKSMEVRGAPLIGATAAYGLVLSIIENDDLDFLKKSSENLINSPNSNKFKMGCRSNDEKTISSRKK
jgi:methylthioribose-1-phosphate isomerase